jgi:signal recognition particle subunit SRP54
MEMIPGMNTLPDTIKIDEKHLKRIEAIINSMTKQERYHPEIIDSSRRRRIASGSGTTLQEVNQLLKQFQQIKVMFKNFSNPKKYKKWRGGEINWLLR